jgi:hypothetical protein
LDKKTDKVAANPAQAVIPGGKIDFETIGGDLNTFVGFSLFSVKKKYGVIDNLAEGFAAENKFWLLTNLVATEEDIAQPRPRVLVEVLQSVLCHLEPG